MKRIIKIEIENYRAFFDKYTIELSKGENLLIYGENGSGKSSLFKALNNYLSSSRDAAFPFTKNHYCPSPDGNINISFQDFDGVTLQPVIGTEQDLSFGSAASTHSVQFVKNAELIKGFLDYRDLLDVYYYEEPKPNLFQLIVLNILGKQLNVAKTFRFAEKWKQLQTDLVDHSYTRNDWTHRIALAELPVFYSALKTVLSQVFKVLNTDLLKEYFPELNIELRFELKPMVFNYKGGKWQWNTTADLRLKVIQYGKIVQDDYSDFLNEARLSAFAVCIYLASLRTNPEAIDCKILFLDDIFIGLDTSNRIPILKILQHEFPKHQIFVTTYDRHLYELARRQFETEDPGKWKTVEFYVGRDIIDTQVYEKPIIVTGESNFERGTQYLHDRIRPDYPASANYFRKALEEIIQQFIPKWEIADLENSNQIPEYKLSPLIFRAKRFLDKTENNCGTANQIISLLPTLLHPLSHHDISSPIYKGELIRVETLIPKWIQELTKLDIPSNYKCSPLEGRNRIRLKFVIDAANNHFSFYELRTTEPICFKLNANGKPIISKVHCFAEKCWGENNGTTIQGVGKTFSRDERKQAELNFISLHDAYEKLHAYITQIPAIGNFPKADNYLDAIESLGPEGIYHPITSIIIW